MSAAPPNTSLHRTPAAAPPSPVSSKPLGAPKEKGGVCVSRCRESRDRARRAALPPGAAPASRASGAFRISDHRKKRMCSGRIDFSSAVSRVVAALVLSIAPGCLEAAEGAGDLPSALAVVDGARDVVRHSAKNELDQVSVFYDGNKPYPAPAVITQIRGKLKKSGWKPLPR